MSALTVLQKYSKPKTRTRTTHSLLHSLTTINPSNSTSRFRSYRMLYHRLPTLVHPQPFLYNPLEPDRWPVVVKMLRAIARGQPPWRSHGTRLEGVMDGEDLGRQARPSLARADPEFGEDGSAAPRVPRSSSVQHTTREGYESQYGSGGRHSPESRYMLGGCRHSPERRHFPESRYGSGGRRHPPSTATHQSLAMGQEDTVTTPPLKAMLAQQKHTLTRLSAEYDRLAKLETLLEPCR